MIRSALLGALAFAALAACNPDRDTPDTGLAGYDPDRTLNAQAACSDDGGSWGKGGKAGGFVCYRETDDANRRCTAATDCEGFCLARSGTCAPVTPVFGCSDVLNSLGARSTLCVD